MSYCPRCGRKIESGRYKCPGCGSLLAYRSSEKKPSILSKAVKYKNPLILVLLATLIVVFKAATVLTTIYWFFIGGLIAAAIVLWLRNRAKRNAQLKQSRPANNRFSSNDYNKNNRFNSRRPVDGNPGVQNKASNVIPFRKRDELKSKARQDR